MTWLYMIIVPNIDIEQDRIFVRRMVIHINLLIVTLAASFVVSWTAIVFKVS